MILSGVLSSCVLSHVQFFVTSLTVAHQAPLSMGFSKQEHWSGLSFSPPGDLPDPGNEPGSPTLQADSLQSELPGKPNSFAITHYQDYLPISQALC